MKEDSNNQKIWEHNDRFNLEDESKYLKGSRFGRYLLNQYGRNFDNRGRVFPLNDFENGTIDGNTAIELAKDYANVIGESYVGVVSLGRDYVRGMRVFSSNPVSHMSLNESSNPGKAWEVV